MSKQLDDLKRDYRNIEAPPHMATRIRAEVADKPIRGHSWMPVGATLMAVVAVIWLVPFIGQQVTTTSPPPSKPSLSALASLKPQKPAVAAPSLAKLRSVKTPMMPVKPQLKPTKPQTRFQIENDLLEEKDHAHI